MQSGKKLTLLPQEMPQLKLIRPKNIAKLIFLLSVLSLTTFYCGYCLAYITALGAQNLSIVYGQNTQIPVVKAFLISCLPFGVTIGTFFSPWVIPMASRRNLTLILCFIAEVFEGLIQIPNLYIFFTIRTLQGINTGFFLSLIPIYIRQISPKEINKKGVFGNFGQLFVIIGFMMSFGFNTILLRAGVNQFIRWRVVVSVNFFAILVIIICIVFDIMPQSPNSLIAKGKQQKAKQVIGYFHQQKFINEIYAEKFKQMEDAKKPPQPQPVRGKRSIVKKILAFQIPIMHQLTGVNAYISQMGFVTAAFDNTFGDYVPFLMGTVQVITAFYSMFYLYRVQRRVMVLSGNLGMSICCIGIGTSFLFINEFPDVFWIVVTLIIVFMGLNGATLIPSVWLYVPQVATKQQIRWSQVTNWFACASSVAIFIIIGSTFGYASIFLAFGVTTFLLFIFNSIYMIQTKPKLKQLVNIQLINIELNATSGEDRQAASIE